MTVLFVVDETGAPEGILHIHDLLRAGWPDVPQQDRPVYGGSRARRRIDEGAGALDGLAIEPLRDRLGAGIRARPRIESFRAPERLPPAGGKRLGRARDRAPAIGPEASSGFWSVSRSMRKIAAPRTFTGDRAAAHAGTVELTVTTPAAPSSSRSRRAAVEIGTRAVDAEPQRRLRRSGPSSRSDIVERMHLHRQPASIGAKRAKEASTSAIASRWSR